MFFPEVPYVPTPLDVAKRAFEVAEADALAAVRRVANQAISRFEYARGLADVPPTVGEYLNTAVNLNDIAGACHVLAPGGISRAMVLSSITSAAAIAGGSVTGGGPVTASIPDTAYHADAGEPVD